MPFKNEEQKQLLRWKYPKVYKKWKKKYGTKIQVKGDSKKRGTVRIR